MVPPEAKRRGPAAKTPVASHHPSWYEQPDVGETTPLRPLGGARGAARSSTAGETKEVTLPSVSKADRRAARAAAKGRAGSSSASSVGSRGAGSGRERRRLLEYKAGRPCCLTLMGALHVATVAAAVLCALSQILDVVALWQNRAAYTAGGGDGGNGGGDGGGSGGIGRVLTGAQVWALVQSVALRAYGVVFAAAVVGTELSEFVHPHPGSSTLPAALHGAILENNVLARHWWARGLAYVFVGLFALESGREYVGLDGAANADGGPGGGAAAMLDDARALAVVRYSGTLLMLSGACYTVLGLLCCKALKGMQVRELERARADLAEFHAAHAGASSSRGGAGVAGGGSGGVGEGAPSSASAGDAARRGDRRSASRSSRGGGSMAGGGCSDAGSDGGGGAGGWLRAAGGRISSLWPASLGGGGDNGSDAGSGGGGWRPPRDSWPAAGYGAGSSAGERSPPPYSRPRDSRVYSSGPRDGPSAVAGGAGKWNRSPVLAPSPPPQAANAVFGRRLSSGSGGYGGGGGVYGSGGGGGGSGGGLSSPERTASGKEDGGRASPRFGPRFDTRQAHQAPQAANPFVSADAADATSAAAAVWDENEARDDRSDSNESVERLRLLGALRALNRHDVKPAVGAAGDDDYGAWARTRA